MATYPSAPDFVNPGPDAMDPNGWWTYTRTDGSINVCAADGSTVVQQAQAVLGIPATATWDNTLQSALIAKAQSFNAAQPNAGWGSFITELQNGQAQQTVTPNAMKFVIWLAYYQANGLRLDAINILSNAALPPYGTSLVSGPASGEMACWDPNRDQAIYTLQQSDFAAAQQASSAGIRLHAGETLPAPSLPVPPPGPSGLPTWALVLIGVAAIALVGWVVFENKQYTRKEETRRTSVPPPLQRVPRTRSATASVPGTLRSSRSRTAV
jgi:hypothetical protein